MLGGGDAATIHAENKRREDQHSHRVPVDSEPAQDAIVRAVQAEIFKTEEFVDSANDALFFFLSWRGWCHLHARYYTSTMEMANFRSQES